MIEKIFKSGKRIALQCGLNRPKFQDATGNCRGHREQNFDPTAISEGGLDSFVEQETGIAAYGLISEQTLTILLKPSILRTKEDDSFLRSAWKIFNS